MIKIPNDPAIISYNEKLVERDKLGRDRAQIARAKDKGRTQFSEELQNPSLSSEERNLMTVSYGREMQSLDASEGDILRKIKQVDQDLSALKVKRNRAIILANYAAYEQILRNRVRAAILVEKANEEEAAFHDELRANDVSNPLRPMALKYVGIWNDAQSPCHFHLRELKQFFPELASEDFER